MVSVKMANVKVGNVLNCLATDGFEFVGVSGVVEKIHRFGLVVTLWLSGGVAYQGMDTEIVTIVKGE